MDSTKNICNEPDKMKTLSKLKDLLTDVQKDIHKMSRDIGGLSKLTLAQDTFFLYDDSNLTKNTYITELDSYIPLYGSIFYSGKRKENNKVDVDV